MRPSHALFPLFLSALFVLQPQQLVTAQEERPVSECEDLAFGAECTLSSGYGLAGACNLDGECMPVGCNVGDLCRAGSGSRGNKYIYFDATEGCCKCGARQKTELPLCSSITNITEDYQVEIKALLDLARASLEAKRLWSLEHPVTLGMWNLEAAMFQKCEPGWSPE